MNRTFWKGRRVLVTGHTGFKGAWLSLWLAERGATVAGLALSPSETPSLYDLVGVDHIVSSTVADINDRQALHDVFSRSEPEIVFHLAAQALVQSSYDDPVSTFATNVTGVVSLLDAVRRWPSVKAVIIVTSDKCYENREWVWGYRETDRLGGRDPYSASKGCAEIAARSMQMSFFKPFVPDGHNARIATVRGGNVIGGGDWSKGRLVPDIVRGCLGPSGEVHLRSPGSVRPWQHVLDALSAYVRIAELLAQGCDGMDEAWNIGPDPTDNRTVRDVAEALIGELGLGRIVAAGEKGAHEAGLLTLDSSKARLKLGWLPSLNFQHCIAFTADWYSAWHKGRDMADVTRRQIDRFERISSYA